MTLTEDQINTDHKEEMRRAADTHGGIFNIPREILRDIQERTRQAWVRFVDQRDGGGDSVIKHDKTARLKKWIAENPGRQVTVEDLVAAGECSSGTAYKFISDNRSSFTKVKGGVYVVVDVNAERAAARSGSATTPATLPAPASNPSPAVTTAAAESEIAMRALDAMNGQSEPRRYGTPGRA